MKIGRKYKNKAPMHEVISGIAHTRFDIQNAEGSLAPSSPLGIYKFSLFIIFVLFFGLALKAVELQVIKGEEFNLISKNNSFTKDIIFANRGLIYDRDDVLLVSNKLDDELYRRDYKANGFGQLLGFVTYPRKDKNNKYFRSSVAGVAGVEHFFDEILSGENGIISRERDAKNKQISSYVLKPSRDGDNVYLSIDSRLQGKAYEFLGDTITDLEFEAGAAVMMDINTGEILFSVSYPDFDSNELNRANTHTVNSYLNDPRKIFLNRVISGLYTPGSTVKPFFALAALEENLVTPQKLINSVGALIVENPYDKDNPSIFKDWKVHGLVNLKSAIANSSNEYFYHIGGGSKIQKGLGIGNINRYANLFGLGKNTRLGFYAEPKGVVPNPSWKKEVFDDDWRLGDTYNTVIGQYGFQVTPLQMLRAYSLIARDGSYIEPHFKKDSIGNLITREFSKQNIAEVKKGMRLAVIDGTAKTLDVHYSNFAAKTGTAQVGSKGFVNSLIGGYFPYEDPKYAFFFLLEKGKTEGYPIGTFTRSLFDWMSINTPEYFGG